MKLMKLNKAVCICSVANFILIYLPIHEHDGSYHLSSPEPRQATDFTETF